MTADGGKAWQQGMRKLEGYRSEKGDLLVAHSHVGWFHSWDLGK